MKMNSARGLLWGVYILFAMITLAFTLRSCTARAAEPKPRAELIADRAKIEEAIAQIQKLFEKEQKAYLETKPYKDHQAKKKAIDDEYLKTAPAQEFTEKVKALQGRLQEAQGRLQAVDKALVDGLVKDGK